METDSRKENIRCLNEELTRGRPYTLASLGVEVPEEIITSPEQREELLRFRTMGGINRVNQEVSRLLNDSFGVWREEGAKINAVSEASLAQLLSDFRSFAGNLREVLSPVLPKPKSSEELEVDHQRVIELLRESRHKSTSPTP